MLILARQLNERIRIGEDIVVVVCGIRNGVVRIGIEAPKDVVIQRQEVFDTKRINGEQ